MDESKSSALHPAFNKQGSGVVIPSLRENLEVVLADPLPNIAFEQDSSNWSADFLPLGRIFDSTAIPR